MAQLTSKQIWQELEKQIFAVLGMVTAKNEARTVGIVYIVHDHKLYISSECTAWKARHIQQNPHISLTVPIAKRIPFIPWIKIPAATITFSGKAQVYNMAGISTEIKQALFRGMERQSEANERWCVIEVEPIGDFLTYGVGVSLMAMRDRAQARGRVAVV